jgi:hypothetical protein
LSKLLATHWPHIAFVLIGVVAFFWTAYRKGPDNPRAQVAPVAAPPKAVRTAPVSAARRGLMALGPLVAALATGAILYGMNVGNGAVPGALTWGHVGVSVLALLLVAYKLVNMRGKQIRRALRVRRLPEVFALALAVLFVPLLITGIQLVLVPQGDSFAAYAHLVSSAWWTVLLLWHLRRYVGASLRAVAGRSVEAPARAPETPEVPARPVESPARLPAG